MKRNILWALAFLLTPACLQAAPINLSKAYSIANAFMKACNGASIASNNVPLRAPGKAGTGKQESYYYIFNADNNQGYVIVSGDDRMPSVLGYATEGSVEERSMPDNMKGWLYLYQEEIKALDQRSVSSQKKVRRSASGKIYKAISPMLTCKWNQASPYNAQCPMLNGGRAVTGCVATAMAQLMYYYRKLNASQTTQAIPSYSFTFNGQTYTEPAIDAGTAINWSKLTATYSSNSTVESKEAVAQLMRLCADALRMNYSTNASATYNAYVPEALVNYFGYDKNTTYVQRLNYDYESWNRLIYNEIYNKRPVIYGGGSSDGGGHCFVIDGYDGNDYYHVNWGWGGISNGYFLLPSLNPSEGGIGAGNFAGGYQFLQDAVIGAQPDNGGESLDLPMMFDNLKVSATSLTGSFINSVGSSATIKAYNFGFGYLASNGKLKPIASKTAELKGGTGVNFSCSLSSLARKADGEYHIYPISRNADSTTWLNCWSDADNHYVKAVVSDGTLTSVTLVEPKIEARIDTFILSGSQMAKDGQTVSITMTNQGLGFGCDAWLIEKSGSAKKTIAKTYLALPQGSTKTISFNYMPSTQGTKTLILSKDQSGTDILASKQFTIMASRSMGTNARWSVYSFNLNGKDDGAAKQDENGKPIYNVYGNALVGSISLRPTKSLKNVVPIVKVQQNDGESWTDIYTSDKQGYASIGTGNAIELPFDIENLDPGTYKIVIESYTYANGDLTLDWTADYDQFNLQKGITVWYSDLTKKIMEQDGELAIPETAVAVDMTTGIADEVTPNSNPNTVYYANEDDALPATFNNKNVVLKDALGKFTAKAIHIYDGHSFLMPQEVTADSAVYHRTFTQAGNMSNWQSIVVPFKTKKIIEGNKTLTWFRKKGETDKDLWIAQLTSDYTDKLGFGYVTSNELSANVPYLVSTPQGLTKKDLLFVSTKVRIQSTGIPNGQRGDYHKLAGVVTDTKLTNIYTLNTTGTAFEMQDNTTLNAFRGCVIGFGALAGSTKYKELPIVFDIADNTTGIQAINKTPATCGTTVYTISGSLVYKSEKAADIKNMPLAHGIYIVNGKKVVK